MSCSSVSSRRRFLKATVLGGLAAATGSIPLRRTWAAPTAAGTATRVALMHGDNRADNVFRAMSSMSREIAAAIGNRRVVLKPNNVSVNIQLASTHADFLEGILEFLKSIDKLQGTVIAESAANGPTAEGYSNFGYNALAERYGVKLVDLDQQPTDKLYVFDEKDMRPHAVRMSRLLLDRDTFVISAAKMKTHDRVVATLSLKNVVVGAPVKDPGFRWGKGGRPGATTQKPIVHGSGIHGINYNLFTLARRLRPDLAAIDGFDGMQGNGPTAGTAVDHRVAVVSPDWLAADRVGVELMGIDFAKVGYLNYCADAGLGQADLKQIEVLGEPIDRHRRTYELARNIEKQLSWMKPPAAAEGTH